MAIIRVHDELRMRDEDAPPQVGKGLPGDPGYPTNLYGTIWMHPAYGEGLYAKGQALEGTVNWGTLPGAPPCVIGDAQNGLLQGGAISFGGQFNPAPNNNNNSAAGWGRSAHYWKANQFHHDQWAQVFVNAWIVDSLGWRPGTRSDGPGWGCSGASVRNDPATGDCYVVYPLYRALDPNQAWNDEFIECRMHIAVLRIRNGVETPLFVGDFPGWTHADDWWAIQIQAYGQNPVRLRVISLAPACYVLGSTPWRGVDSLGPGGILDEHLPSGGAYNAAVHGEIGPGHQMDIGDAWYGWSNDHDTLPHDAVTGKCNANWTSAENDSENPTGGRSNPTRAWILWEGIDDSPQRIVSGQPGFRYGGGPYFEVAKFTAGTFEGAELTADEPAAAGGGSYTLKGQRVAGRTITVSGPAGTTVGPVAYPTDTTWECVVSNVT